MILSSLTLLTLVALTFLFTSLVSPLSMGCCLLIMTLNLAVFLSCLSSHLWFSYILVLILLGGLLVIFVYVSLTATNEKFYFNHNIFLVTMLPIVLIFLSSNNTHLFHLNEDQNWSVCKSNTNYFMNELYSSQLYLVTLFLIIYLLLTLFIVVFNTKNTQMTLRSF